MRFTNARPKCLRVKLALPATRCLNSRADTILSICRLRKPCSCSASITWALSWTELIYRLPAALNTTRTTDLPAKDSTDTRIGPSLTSVSIHLLTSSAASRSQNPSLLPVVRSALPVNIISPTSLNPKSGEGGQVGFLGLIGGNRFPIWRIYNWLQTFNSFNLKETEALLWDKETPFCGLLPICFTFLASALFIVPRSPRLSSRLTPARLRQHNRAGRGLTL